MGVTVTMSIQSVSTVLYTIIIISYTTKSSTFAYNCLSYFSMLINLCGEENMTRVIGHLIRLSVLPYDTLSTYMKGKYLIFSHLLSSSK